MLASLGLVIIEKRSNDLANKILLYDLQLAVALLSDLAIE